MKIKNGYMLREVAGYSVVVPVTDETQSFNGMINLNETGAFLWRALEKGVSQKELSEMLASEYDIDTESAEADTADFIAKLKDAELLTE